MPVEAVLTDKHRPLSAVGGVDGVGYVLRYTLRALLKARRGRGEVRKNILMLVKLD